MPQEEAGLLRAIRDDPEDDSVRLVYADWLEEHGQPERAELIRVQIELGRRPLAPERCELLTARQTKLLTEDAPTWLGPLVAHLGHKYLPRGWSYRRGMPVVALTPRKFLGKKFQALAAEWFPRAGVHVVELNGTTSRLPSIGESPLLGGLHTLEFYDTDATDADVKAFAGSPNLGGLHSLTLGQSRMQTEGVRALANSPHLPRLRHLTLCGNAGIGLGVGDLVASPLWPRLTSLNLGGAGIGPGQLTALLKALPRSRIRRLDIGMNGLTERSCRALAECPAVRALTHLELSDDVGTAGVEALAGSPHLAGLRELRLSLSSLGDADALVLTRSPHLGQLTRLDLEMNDIGPAGAEALRARFGVAVLLD
jgi:uncharacterized protein (TIGR02996 family)